MKTWKPPKYTTEQLLCLQVRRVSCKNTASRTGVMGQMENHLPGPQAPPLRSGSLGQRRPTSSVTGWKVPPTRQNALLYLNAFMIQSHTQAAEEESFRTGQAVQHATPLGDDGIQGVVTVVGGQPDGWAGQCHLNSVNVAFPFDFCKHQQYVRESHSCLLQSLRRWGLCGGVGWPSGLLPSDQHAQEITSSGRGLCGTAGQRGHSLTGEVCLLMQRWGCEDSLTDMLKFLHQGTDA